MRQNLRRLLSPRSLAIIVDDEAVFTALPASVLAHGSLAELLANSCSDEKVPERIEYLCTYKDGMQHEIWNHQVEAARRLLRRPGNVKAKWRSVGHSLLQIQDAVRLRSTTAAYMKAAVSLIHSLGVAMVQAHEAATKEDLADFEVSIHSQEALWMWAERWLQDVQRGEFTGQVEEALALSELARQASITFQQVKVVVAAAQERRDRVDKEKNVHRIH